MSEQTTPVEVTAEATEKTQQELTALSFEQVFGLIGEKVQGIGQIIFVEDASTEGGVSKTFNIIRVLTDGSKQLFKICVEEASSVTITK